MNSTDIATKSTVAQTVQKIDAVVGATNEDDFKDIVMASSNFEEFQKNVKTSPRLERLCFLRAHQSQQMDRDCRS